MWSVIGLLEPSLAPQSSESAEKLKTTRADESAERSFQSNGGSVVFLFCFDFVFFRVLHEHSSVEKHNLLFLNDIKIPPPKKSYL